MLDMSFLESRQESPTFMTGISDFHAGYLRVSPPVSGVRRTAVLSFPTMQSYAISLIPATSYSYVNMPLTIRNTETPINLTVCYNSIISFKIP